MWTLEKGKNDLTIGEKGLLLSQRGGRGADVKTRAVLAFPIVKLPILIFPFQQRGRDFAPAGATRGLCGRPLDSFAPCFF